MLFNSLTYWLFLPLVVLIYFILQPKYRWVLLLISSYLFYGWWNTGFLVLILISTLVDYWAGLKMGNMAEKKGRKPYLYFSLAVNLGMLFFFKYFGFFNESIRSVLFFFEMNYPVKPFDILLPVGISFYTFQTLSYTIDVYRGDRESESHLGIFALYVSFFPQLVAGPIERSTTFLPQLRQENKINWQRMLDGSKLIVWGLFKKMVLADNLAIFVNNVYDTPSAYSGNMLVLAAYSFTIQVYCDFSGYTDIAIGSAKIFGFNLSNNFDRPLFASSISKLWRKWHISLTQWIRYYLYVPLKTRYTSNVSSYVILFVVLIIIGIWHGVGWHFVLFGLIHGVFLTIQRLTTTYRIQFSNAVGISKKPQLEKLIGVFITFNLWTFSLICFANKDLENTLYVMKNIFSGGETIASIASMNGFYESTIFVVFSSGILFFWVELTNKNDLRNPFRKIKNTIVRWGVYLFVVFWLLIFRVNENMEFYYFQF